MDGVNYFFVDHDRFCAMRDQGEFVEWATVFGNYYGTSHAEIDRVTASGRHVILEIDWQGAQQIRQARPGARSIFILPPSMQTLHERLLQRAQDDHKTIARRMDEAISEMSHYAEFDYVIVNDDFETALDEIDRIIHGEIGQTELSPGRDALKPLIADLLPARPV